MLELNPGSLPPKQLTAQHMICCIDLAPALMNQNTLAKESFPALAGFSGSQQQVTAGAPAGDCDFHHALPGCHQRQLPPSFLDVGVVLLRKVQGGTAGLPQALVGAARRRAVPPAVLLRLLEPANQRSQARA